MGSTSNLNAGTRWIQCILFLCLLVSGSSVFGQDDRDRDREGNELHVGDLIEFEFRGKTVQAEIIDFTGTGWPTVEVEIGGRMREWFTPGRDVTLVESSSEEPSPPSKQTKSTEFRTWSDATGKFSVDAKFISRENDEIKLEKEDGRVITLALEKLSKADQDYLAELAKDEDPDNPFAGGEPTDPFSGGESLRSPEKRKRKSRNSASRRAVSNTKTITPRIRNSMSLRQVDWKVTPDPASTEMEDSGRSIYFSSNPNEHEFHNNTAARIGVDGKFAAVCVSNPFENSSSLISIDFVKGSASAPVSIPVEKAEIFAVSNNGDTILTLRESKGREQGGLEFWNVAGGSAKLEAVWRTKGFFDRSGFDPKSGIFVGKNRLLTFGDQIALWDCETAESFYSIDVFDRAKPSLSPAGNQLAISSSTNIYLIAIKDGTVLGSIDTDGTAYQHLAFSQSGQFLAGLETSSGAVAIWDLESAELVQQFGSPAATGKSILWCGDDYVLVDEKYLMDVELRATVWEYETDDGTIARGANGQFWFVSDSRLTPIQLPHKDLRERTAEFDPDDLLVLKPGAEVSIELESDFAPSEQREIIAALKDRLKDKGIVVSEVADIQLVAQVKKQEKESVEVRPFFDPIGPFGQRSKTETITYTPNLATIEIQRNGRKFWGKLRRFGPAGVIHSQENESTQQAANRICKPNPDFFKNVEFPEYFAQLPSGEALGSSEISERGIR